MKNPEPSGLVFRAISDYHGAVVFCGHVAATCGQQYAVLAGRHGYRGRPSRSRLTVVVRYEVQGSSFPHLVVSVSLPVSKPRVCGGVVVARCEPPVWAPSIGLAALPSNSLTSRVESRRSFGTPGCSRRGRPYINCPVLWEAKMNQFVVDRSCRACCRIIPALSLVAAT